MANNVKDQANEISEPKKYVKLLHDYRAVTEDEINGVKDEVFELLSDEDEVWWFVKKLINNNTSKDEYEDGFIPKTFLALDNFNANSLESEAAVSQQTTAAAASSSFQVMDKSPKPSASPITKQKDVKSFKPLTIPRPSSQPPPPKDRNTDPINNIVSPTARVPLSPSYSVNSARASSPKRTGRSSPVKTSRALSDPMRRRATSAPRGNASSSSRPLAVQVTEPFLAKYMTDGESYVNVLKPKVSENGLGLEDLMLDHEQDKVLLIPSSSSILLCVNDGRNVPNPSIPGKVVSRFIRVGIFSQRQVVSNVYTIPCDETDVCESPHWTVRQSSFNLSIPKDCLVVRANSASVNPCVLFEMCVRIKAFNLNSINAKKRISESADIPDEEYSCAWGLLPINGPDGKAIEAKSYEVKLYGGSPINMDFLPLDREKVKQETWFSSLFNMRSHESRLQIKLFKMGIQLENEINALPMNIVTDVERLPLIAMYRQLVANVLMRDQGEPTRLVFYQPSIARFPKLISDPILAQELASKWYHRVQQFTRKEKKSFHFQLEEFDRIVSQFVPLLEIIDFKFPNGAKNLKGEDINLIEREKIMRHYLMEGPISVLARNPNNFSFVPLDIEKEYAFTAFPVQSK